MASRTSRATRTTRVTVVSVMAVLVLAGLGRCADIEQVTGGGVGMPVSSSSLAPPPPPASDPATPPDPGPGVPGSVPIEPPPPEPAPSGDPLVASARLALPQLEIKGRAPKTGYDRALFGQAWSDDVSVEFGRNGCDTRNDILRRDLQDITVRPGTRDCVVLTGVLYGPYTGERIEFVRGQDTSSAVQIDHVVALSDAWQKGAQQLTLEQRRDFANDPLNLLAVAGHANQSKGDGDAATWLPPRREFRCPMIARQILVKERYGLWVTHAEHEAMERVLAGCA
ncbi:MULTISPECIES: HNH endonuclease family protein [unclassified Dietzia]|uniref:HNH endonuclease family protein n=1 Tax=unclassified Dietzia TaxID=2617939 RepID=UPI001E34376E|nr:MULTISPECIES: HNH endonuclease family protein [unclassified Dietzia]